MFVVGSPRSGTSFTAGAIGDLPGVRRPRRGAAAEGGDPAISSSSPRTSRRRRSATSLQRVRGLAFVRSLRGVEQTPETAFVLPAALQAFPPRPQCTSCATAATWSARCSSAAGSARDAAPRATTRSCVRRPPALLGRARAAGGVRRSVSDARRAAWAWRRYVTAARAAPGRTVERALRAPRHRSGGGTGALARMLGVGARAAVRGVRGRARELGRALAARPHGGAARRRRGRSGPAARRARLQLGQKRRGDPAAQLGRSRGGDARALPEIELRVAERPRVVEELEREPDLAAEELRGGDVDRPGLLQRADAVDAAGGEMARAKVRASP